MTEAEVKAAIGEKNWPDFVTWMNGQTCGLNEDGTLDYYSQDVRAFQTKLRTGYDRQQGPAWD